MAIASDLIADKDVIFAKLSDGNISCQPPAPQCGRHNVALVKEVTRDEGSPSDHIEHPALGFVETSVLVKVRSVHIHMMSL